jgi:hypothetical protein
MDIHTIDVGEDFVDAIGKAGRSCNVLVALIGRQWLTASDANGGRRLDDPDDLVRQEIAVGLERDVQVIPVLVQGASMPPPQDLPEPLRRLARRNALVISHTHPQSDVDVLIQAIEKQ